MSRNKVNPLAGFRTRLKNMGPMAPRVSFGMRFNTGTSGNNSFRLPFRRSPVFILIAFGFLAAFSIPYFTMGDFLAAPEDDSLFSLVFLLFSLFWFLGWSVGVLVLLGVFLLVSCGTEVVQIRPGWVTIRFEVLRLGVGLDFRAEGIEGLRWLPAEVEQAAKDSGHGWRGDHMAFDYGDETIRFGSAIDNATAEQVFNRIRELAVARSPGLTMAESRQQQAEAALSASGLVAAGDHSPVHREEDPGLHSASTRVLVLANLIPLSGVLLADWNIGDIMLLFWAESAIIGLFNLLKMWVIGRWSIVFLGPFFAGHFGGFMVGHLLFIYTLFLSGTDSVDPTVSQVFADFISLWPALLGLVVSHAVSFRINFLGRREFENTTVKQQMSAPYKRIIVMHVTIIFGGFLTMAFETPLLALVLLIVLKILVDLKAHISEHRRDSVPLTAS